MQSHQAPTCIALVSRINRTERYNYRSLRLCTESVAKNPAGQGVQDQHRFVTDPYTGVMRSLMDPYNVI
eukprot:3791775-Pleurochrysis_carterae.AAC.2